MDFENFYVEFAQMFQFMTLYFKFMEFEMPGKYGNDSIAYGHDCESYVELLQSIYHVPNSIYKMCEKLHKELKEYVLNGSSQTK